MLREPGQHLPDMSIVTGNAQRQRADMLSADLVDPRRQKRDIDAELAREPRNDGIAGGRAAELHANDRLAALDRLRLDPACERDRDAVAEDFGEKALRDGMLRVGEDIGYVPVLHDMAGI